MKLFIKPYKVNRVSRLTECSFVCELIFLYSEKSLTQYVPKSQINAKKSIKL